MRNKYYGQAAQRLSDKIAAVHHGVKLNAFAAYYTDETNAPHPCRSEYSAKHTRQKSTGGEAQESGAQAYGAAYDAVIAYAAAEREGQEQGRTRDYCTGNENAAYGFW